MSSSNWRPRGLFFCDGSRGSASAPVRANRRRNGRDLVNGGLITTGPDFVDVVSPSPNHPHSSGPGGRGGDGAVGGATREGVAEWVAAMGANVSCTIVARLIGQSLSERLGQSFVIENRRRGHGATEHRHHPTYELVLIDEFQDFNRMEAAVIGRRIFGKEGPYHIGASICSRLIQTSTCRTLCSSSNLWKTRAIASCTRRSASFSIRSSSVFK